MTTTDIYQALASITWHDAESWLAWFGALVGVCTVIAAASLKGARALHAYALTTPTTADDVVTSFLVSAAQRAVSVLAFLAGWLPRITVGLGDAKRTLDAVKLPKPPRGSGSLLILLVVLPLSSISTGCASFGAPTLRSVLYETDAYLDEIDQTVAERAAEVHEEAMAATEGDPTSAEYERRMRPWDRIDRAIEGAQVALLGVFTSSLSVQAGRAGDVFGSIACAVRSLSDLLGLLPLVNVTVPDKLEEAIDFLRGIAGAACPNPPSSSPPAPAPSSDASEPEGTS